MALLSAENTAKVAALRDSLVSHARTLGKTIEEVAAGEIAAYHTQAKIHMVHCFACGVIIGTFVGFVLCWMWVK